MSAIAEKTSRDHLLNVARRALRFPNADVSERVAFYSTITVPSVRDDVFARLCRALADGSEVHIKVHLDELTGVRPAPLLSTSESEALMVGLGAPPWQVSDAGTVLSFLYGWDEAAFVRAVRYARSELLPERLRKGGAA